MPANRAEQIAIAEALGLVDSAILAAQESVAKAERLHKALMQQLLTGRLKPDGTPRRKDEFQETKLGLLPRDWAVARVKDFGEVSTGKTPPTANEGNFGGDYQFITPGDMGETKWIRKTERSLSALGSEHAGVLVANAVCVVCIGATIGKIGLTVRPACTNQQINTVVCSDKHSSEYRHAAVSHPGHGPRKARPGMPGERYPADSLRGQAARAAKLELVESRQRPVTVRFEDSADDRPVTAYAPRSRMRTEDVRQDQPAERPARAKDSGHGPRARRAGEFEYTRGREHMRS